MLALSEIGAIMFIYRVKKVARLRQYVTRITISLNMYIVVVELQRKIMAQYCSISNLLRYSALRSQATDALVSLSYWSAIINKCADIRLEQFHFSCILAKISGFKPNFKHN